MIVAYIEVTHEIHSDVSACHSPTSFSEERAASAQGAINIADLVLAVRQGLIETQQREEEANLIPMFLVKDFEMTITFVVEKGATGGINLKVVTLGGNIKKEQTHTVTIRSETAAFEHVKARLKTCLEGSNRTYSMCFNQAYKELGLTQPGQVLGANNFWYKDSG